MTKAQYDNDELGRVDTNMYDLKSVFRTWSVCMERTEEQFERIKEHFTEGRAARERHIGCSDGVERDAVPTGAGMQGKWRALPACYGGNWNSLYRRMRRWVESGVLIKVLKEWKHMNILPQEVDVASLDSPLAKVHPDGTGVRRKHGPQAIGKSLGGWTTKVHMIAANERHALAFSLSRGEAGDAPEGRKLLSKARISAVHLVMDRAYEDDETRKLVVRLPNSFTFGSLTY